MRVSISDLVVEYTSGGYAVRPIDGLELQAGEGELVLLLGASGCGKTTLLSVLAGILTPTAGSVVVDAWSTKEFDVAVSTGARYAPTPRTTVPSADPACVPTPGADGFTVDLVRTVTRVGDPTLLRSDTVTTTYQPEQAVVCQPAP